MTLADIRNNAQGPHLFTDCIADGVLADVGLAAQEMPATVGGGALTGYLHQTNPTTEHDAFIRPEYRTLPSVFKGSDLTALKTALLTEGAMVVGDLTTVYGRGTSLALQNVGFSPVMPTALATPTNYDYTATLTTMLAAWPGRPPFVNCGDANNWQFLTGSFHFNNAFPLRCRITDNPVRVQTEAATFGVDLSGMIFFNPQTCADTFPGGQGTRSFAKTIYDPTHPVVYDLILEHCTDLASAFGAQLRYIAHGESGISITQTALGATIPSSNVAAHMVTGFRAWLQHQDGLGFTLAAVNARWSTNYLSFAAIDPTEDLFWASAQAVADYGAFAVFVMGELGWHEARACKAADTTTKATRFSFSLRGMEQSTAFGDFGAVGDWQGEPEYGSEIGTPGQGYRETREYLLRPIADAAVLQGVPGQLPITSPTFTVAQSFIGQEGLYPINRALRNYREDQVRWLYRDALRSSGVGIGYLSGTPNFSFGAHAASRSAVLDTIDDIVAMHPHTFAGCGGHARVVLVVDPADARNWRVHGPIDSDGDEPTQIIGQEWTGSARTGHWLHRDLRDRTIGCSVLFDTTLIGRPHVLSLLERSVSVVLLRPDADSLATEFATICPDGGTGAALFVSYERDGIPPYVLDDTPVWANALGVVYACEPNGIPGATNIWAYLVRSRRECETDDVYRRKLAAMISTNVLPFVTAECANSWGAALTTAPVSVEDVAASGATLATNYVGDGLNWTVAISNMSTSGSVDVSVTADAGIASALAVTYAPQSVTLAPGETQFVTLDATLPGGTDVPAAIDDAQAKVAALAGGYADSAAQVTAILDLAESLEISHPARAAALYVSAIRAPLVWASIAAGVATVTVRRLGLIGEATPLVSGARVLALWPLNLREHGASGTTNGSGVASLTLGAPAATHWDFATQQFVAPWADAATLVEFHVTDPTTCASSRVQVTPP